jgi:hypothetical protein
LAVPALEKLNIDTPEQIALEFSLATVGSRFLALAVDTLVQIGCGLVLFAGVGLGAFAASFTPAQAGSSPSSNRSGMVRRQASASSGFASSTSRVVR